MREFEAVRGRLTGLAYRMLGSKVEAEDVVQECYVRWHQAERATVRNPEAWLVTVATRLSIDRLRALKRERTTYIGPWLPEPVMDDLPGGDLSMAFLLLLERLGEEERAAFLLHDVFECEYGAIAETLGKAEATCRQMVHRARERVRNERKRFAVTEAARTGLLQKFAAAMAARDEATLLALFAPAATWTADGGGRTPAARQSVVGAERIARLVMGLEEKFYRGRMRMVETRVNGEAGLRVEVEGRVNAVLTVDCEGERITAVYVVLNPDKLRDIERIDTR